MMAPTDLAIVGGGSAAFAAALRAAELGARATIIEAGTIGGTCVNVGCVPSKALLRAAELVHRTKSQAFAGVRATPAQIDFGRVMRQKDELVAELRQGKYRDVVAGVSNIRVVQGWARFDADGTLQVAGAALEARKILIATGARPWMPPIAGLDSVGALDSTGALSLETLPRRLVVLGGSAVGLELAQLFARMGTQVTVIEARDRLAPAEDDDVGPELAAHLRAEGVDIVVGAKVLSAERAGTAVCVQLQVDGRQRTVEADQLLVATGRRPNTDGLGLEAIGVRLGSRGEVLVDEHHETSRAGIYAAGDVTGDPMFVYVAAQAGYQAATNALGNNSVARDLRVVPRVIFTDPQVASVGLTEREARAQGLDIITSKLPLSHVPRAIVARDTRGFIKLVADASTKRLFGAHIVAPEAGEVIQEAVLAMRFGIRIDQIAETLHPYLTLAEGIKLAAQTFEKDVGKLSCCAA